MGICHYVIGSFIPIMNERDYICHYGRSISSSHDSRYVSYQMICDQIRCEWEKDQTREMWVREGERFMTDMGICHYAHDRIEISSPLLSLMVEPPKGTESLTIHMVRVWTLTHLFDFIWGANKHQGSTLDCPGEGRSHSLFIWWGSSPSPLPYGRAP